MSHNDPFNDPPLGYGDRTIFLADLEAAVDPAGPETVLAIFDLDGFDEYRRLYGLIDSRALLVRLSVRLADALGDASTFYRTRETELAAIIHAPSSVAIGLIDAAVSALRDSSTTVTVRAAFGAVVLPDEADEPLAAVMLADERLSLAGMRRARERRRELR